MLKRACLVALLMCVASCTPGSVMRPGQEGGPTPGVDGEAPRRDGSVDPLDSGTGRRDGSTERRDGSTATRDAGGVNPCLGCIDRENGACRRGVEDTACGSDGESCNVCGPNELCDARACVARDACGPADCEGCCDGLACIRSDDQVACGRGGEMCVACNDNEQCIDGECQVPAVCGAANCDGCCNGDGVDACQTGDTVRACGSGGAVCNACEAGWRCVDGECTPPCEESCDGCCDGETCLDGLADEACGGNGAACIGCGAGYGCFLGYCVESSCSETCDGCCDGDVCFGGRSSTACGAGGYACVDCGSGFSCLDAECVVSGSSRWNLWVRWAQFATTDWDGNAWDPFNGLPDPYATVVFTGDAGTVYSGATTTIDDTVTPRWDRRVITDVPARDLQLGIELRVIDDDGFGDDNIGFCYWVPSQAAFRARSLRLTCPARSASPESIEVQVGVELQPA